LSVTQESFQPRPVPRTPCGFQCDRNCFHAGSLCTFVHATIPTLPSVITNTEHSSVVRRIDDKKPRFPASTSQRHPMILLQGPCIHSTDTAIPHLKLARPVTPCLAVSSRDLPSQLSDPASFVCRASSPCCCPALPLALKLSACRRLPFAKFLARAPPMPSISKT